MTENDPNGRKRLKELAATVREKTNPAGESVLHVRGLQMIEELAKELTKSTAISIDLCAGGISNAEHEHQRQIR